MVDRAEKLDLGRVERPAERVVEVQRGREPAETFEVTAQGRQVGGFGEEGAEIAGHPVLQVDGDRGPFGR